MVKGAYCVWIGCDHSRAKNSCSFMQIEPEWESKLEGKDRKTTSRVCSCHLPGIDPKSRKKIDVYAALQKTPSDHVGDDVQKSNMPGPSNSQESVDLNEGDMVHLKRAEVDINNEGCSNEKFGVQPEEGQVEDDNFKTIRKDWKSMNVGKRPDQHNDQDMRELRPSGGYSQLSQGKCLPTHQTNAPSPAHQTNPSSPLPVLGQEDLDLILQTPEDVEKKCDMRMTLPLDGINGEMGHPDTQGLPGRDGVVGELRNYGTSTAESALVGTSTGESSPVTVSTQNTSQTVFIVTPSSQQSQPPAQIQQIRISSPVMTQIKTETQLWQPQPRLNPQITLASTTKRRVKKAAVKSAPTGRPKQYSSLKKMKVPELRAELKRRNLAVSGPKPKLIERLKPHADAIIKNSRGKSLVSSALSPTSSVLSSKMDTSPLPVLSPQSEMMSPHGSVTSTKTMDFSRPGSAQSFTSSGTAMELSRPPSVLHVAPSERNKPEMVPMDVDYRSFDNSSLFTGQMASSSIQSSQHLNHSDQLPSFPTYSNKFNLMNSTNLTTLQLLQQAQSPPQVLQQKQQSVNQNQMSTQISNEDLIKQQQETIMKLQTQLQQMQQQQSQQVPLPHQQVPQMGHSYQQQQGAKLTATTMSSSQSSVQPSQVHAHTSTMHGVASLGQPAVMMNLAAQLQPATTTVNMNGLTQPTIPKLESASLTPLKEAPGYDEAKKQYQWPAETNSRKTETLDDVQEILTRFGEWPTNAAEEPFPAAITTRQSSTVPAAITTRQSSTVPAAITTRQSSTVPAAIATRQCSTVPALSLYQSSTNRLDTAGINSTSDLMPADNLPQRFNHSSEPDLANRGFAEMDTENSDSLLDLNDHINSMEWTNDRCDINTDTVTSMQTHMQDSTVFSAGLKGNADPMLSSGIPYQDVLDLFEF